MRNIIIALLFTITMQSFDLLIKKQFYLINSGFFFILILFLTIFCKKYKPLYIFIFILSFIHYLFFSYFHRVVDSTDIYLFFTHIEETFESFYALPSLFVLPSVLFIVGLFLLWCLKRVTIKPYPLNSWLKYFLLSTLIFINLNSSMGMQLLNALATTSFKETKNLYIKEIPLYPLRKADINIVLLIGESMKYNNLVEEKLKAQKHLYKNYFYRKIYAGATNTDVSVPLLLNSKTNPLELNKHNESNLFRLAKKNHFNTAFVSIQTEKSLYYIKPYLQLAYVDFYKSYSKKERKPLFDFLLLDTLTKTDFSKNNFLVMQQVGEHSPYKFFNGEASINPKENYKKSVEYSFRLYENIYKKLIETKKPFVFIYTSDHGEFTGEGGRYGHNSFEKTIYEVPMFMTSNVMLPKEYRDISSHYHLSEFLTYMLGYKKKLELSKNKSVINGTMISREDGFRVVE